MAATTKSVIILVVIKACTKGTLSPHRPSPVHCAEMGSQRKTNAMQKLIVHAARTTMKMMEDRWMNVVTNTRMKKHSMLALTVAKMITYRSCVPNTTWAWFSDGLFCATKGLSVPGSETQSWRQLARTRVSNGTSAFVPRTGHQELEAVRVPTASP